MLESVSLVLVELSLVVSLVVVESIGAAVLMLVVAVDMLLTEVVVDTELAPPTLPPQRKSFTVPRNI